MTSAAPVVATPEAPPLVLGPDMTIAQAAHWRDVLASALAPASQDLRLDLGGVTDIDSSAVQLLLASANSLAGRGLALRLAAASAPVREALQVFGLQALLGEPPEDAA